jgi:segregation and condensation protein A
VPYEVHLEVYDGPFDLLLQLITAQQVDLYEVRLADIVDAFLAELRRIESLDLEIATEFLLIAATLVELKCRRLLPGGGEIDLDEELSLFEARDYLLARLLECKTFSGAAQALHTLEQASALSHGRRSGPEEEYLGLEPDLLRDVRPEDLARAFAKLLVPKEVPVISVAHVHEDEVSVAETIERLVAELPRRPRTTLRELIGRNAPPAQFVATFLALLELYKRELVELSQLSTFGEVEVSWSGQVADGQLIVEAAAREYDLEGGEADDEGAAAGEGEDAFLLDEGWSDPDDEPEALGEMPWEREEFRALLEEGALPSSTTGHSEEGR